MATSKEYIRNERSEAHSKSPKAEWCKRVFYNPDNLVDVPNREYVFTVSKRRPRPKWDD